MIRRILDVDKFIEKLNAVYHDSMTELSIMPLGIENWMSQVAQYIDTDNAPTMVCYIAKTGYMQVKLSKNGVEKKPLVHRLVALTFLPNSLQLPQVNHIDGDKTNNNVTNLEWCTGSDNQLHSRRILNRVCGMKRKPVICLENGKIYESVSHAARELKLYPKNIAKVCKGKYGKTGGMHFKYVE